MWENKEIIKTGLGGGRQGAGVSAIGAKQTFTNRLLLTQSERFRHPDYHMPTEAAPAVAGDDKMDHPAHSSFEFVRCVVGRPSNAGSGVCPPPACADPYSSGSTTGTILVGRPGESTLSFAIPRAVDRHRHRNSSMNNRGWPKFRALKPASRKLCLAVGHILSAENA